MTAVQDPTVQRRRLRQELKKARDATGRKQVDVTHAMDWSQPKLIRVKEGRWGIFINRSKRSAGLLVYTTRGK